MRKNIAIYNTGHPEAAPPALAEQAPGMVAQIAAGLPKLIARQTRDARDRERMADDLKAAPSP